MFGLHSFFDLSRSSTLVFAHRKTKDLGKRSPVFQINGALLPGHTIAAQLSCNPLPMFRLKHYKITSVGRPALPFHVLCGFGDPIIPFHALVLSNHIASMAWKANREDGRNDLCRLVLLGRSHLETAQPVDAEAHAIFCSFIEYWWHRPEDPLQGLCLSLVVWPRLQAEALESPLCHFHLKGGRPGRRKQDTRCAGSEVSAAEVIDSLLPLGLLPSHKSFQCLDIRKAAIRRNEATALTSAI
mmetsp:Transcript_49641/g.93065  ORF Transcript_49641/g.93065 Transcript_49641/m.93065 type:complete len:242 (+) Transcript_49641:210-935(+)